MPWFSSEPAASAQCAIEPQPAPEPPWQATGVDVFGGRSRVHRGPLKHLIFLQRKSKSHGFSGVFDP